MNRQVIVLKFGSSVLRSAPDLPQAVHEIYRYAREGWGVVAVVSAFQGVTDRLLGEATALGADPAHDVGIAGLAALVASGERETAASLQIALSRSGIPSNLLDPLAIGLRVDGNGLEGSPVDLETERLKALLEKGRVLIVPGFFGSDQEGGVSLLGRGGSDWTALFLAQRLGARCRLLKDTDGIYDRDPNGEAPAPRRFERLNYEDALALGAPVVQEAALRFALSHQKAFEVASLGSVLGTEVGKHRTDLSKRGDIGRPPLRVTLLGLGEVGRGVYEHLLRLPDHFEIVAIAVRDRFRHMTSGVPGRLLFSLDQALEMKTDIVIEAMGGVIEASEAVARALRKGWHVVSANKAVMAAHGVELRAIAEQEGARLSCSAAAGGAIPLIETLRRLGKAVVGLRGVLNGTSNFVLNRMTEGAPLGEAVAEARRLGYAESDPSDDLSGLDAARKLVLVAREAFGVSLRPEDIPCHGMSAMESVQARHGDSGSARPRGPRMVVRQFASVRLTPRGCEAKVELDWVDITHPLGRCQAVDNAVVITLLSGRQLELHGRGAGRWPTAESVMGDLFQLRRELDLGFNRQPGVVREFEARAS